MLLVVDIADSSLRYDSGRKAALYASFSIREFWVIDAVRLTTRIFREPAADGYRDARFSRVGADRPAVRAGGICAAAGGFGAIVIGEA